MNLARRSISIVAGVVAGVVAFGVVPGRALVPPFQVSPDVPVEAARSEEGRVPAVVAVEGPRGVAIERSDPRVAEVLAAAGRVPGPSVTSGPGEVAGVPAATGGVRPAAVDLVPPSVEGPATGQTPGGNGTVVAPPAGEQLIVLPPAPAPRPGQKRPTFDRGTSTRSSRSATGERFANADGSSSIVAGPGAAVDDKGVVVDADATLVAQPGGRLRKRAGIVRAELAAEVGDGTEVVVVGAPGERIGLVFKAPSGAAKGAAKVGKVTGSSVAYADVYGPGTSLEFEASEAGVKESIVLAAGPAAGVKPEYRFGLNLDGLTARVNASGSVSLLDPDGSEKWVVPVGIAYERPRPGEKPSVLGRVGFALEKAADGTTEFVVRPDEAWLRDPARRFPVVIDPTITPGKDSTSNGFATVDSAYPTWHFNLCRTANSTCFGQVSPTQQSYAYLRYDVSAATGKIINSASLKVNGLDCFSAPAWPATLKVRPLLSPVDLATVTWDTRPAARTIEAQAVASAPGSYSVDVGTFVAKWASGEWPAYGFQIDSTKDCELKVNGVGTASYLEITYTDPTPGTNRPPSIPVSQAPVDGSTVSSPVTMSVTSIDPDGDPLQYYFDSCLQPCSGAFVSSGWLNTPNWVHTPGTNGQYWGWWAYATDGITPWVYNGAKFFTVGTPTGASSGESSEWGTSAAYSATSDDNQPNAGVNTGTKRLVFQATDAQVAAAGPALSIVRTYNSGDTSTGVFGTGWSSILDARVDADGSGNLTFRLPDGRREYHPLVGGEYRTAPGYWTTAGVDPNGGWTLLEKDGSLWRFRTDGKFSQIADRNGRALTAVFDAGGKQTELRVRGYGVTRSLTLGWTGSRYESYRAWALDRRAPEPGPD